MIRAIIKIAFRLIRPHLWSLVLCAITGFLCLVTVYLIVWPAYKNPIARMYTSKLGYSTVLRKTGGAFPVQSTTVVPREIHGRFIGEGLVQSEPVQVPMIALARIQDVTVTEGDRVKKGDVIVRLDPIRLKMKIASAEAALQTARAELERVELGTVNVLQQERPDLLKLEAESADAEARVSKKLLDMYDILAKSNSVSNAEHIEMEFRSIRAEVERRKAVLAAHQAEQGRLSSIAIAQSAIREAQMTLDHRLAEMEDYTSLAPSDGVVERVLVHAGEYNQDPGRPAVLLANDLWFECYLDQTALGQVEVGDQVEVRLSAFQDRLVQGAITRVRPLVNFSLGGPETNRPIRPLGTGSPEWPATFSVRVKLDDPNGMIVPGLTGYATVLQNRRSLAVPRGTVTAVSGNRGICYVIQEDGESFEPRNVVVGLTDDHWCEIREGLADGEVVITDGYQVLNLGDRIAATPREEAPELTPVKFESAQTGAVAAGEAKNDSKTE